VSHEYKLITPLIHHPHLPHCQDRVLYEVIFSPDRRGWDLTFFVTDEAGIV
jgi:hypothetical protein